MVHSSLCNILPGSRKHYFHSTDWDLVSWPYLTAREAGIVAFMLGSQIVLPRKKKGDRTLEDNSILGHIFQSQPTPQGTYQFSG